MNSKFWYYILVIYVFGAFNKLSAQTAISSITTTTQTATSSSYNAVAPSDASNSLSPGTTYTMSYGNGNNIFISSYTVGTTTYDNFITPDTLILQRTDAGELINIWYDLNTTVSGTTIEMAPQQITNIDAMYQAGLVNVGYGNLLVNNDDQNTVGDFNDQVERIDVIYRTGLVTSSPGTAMFPIVEMGGNDEFKIAAITSLDANGEPASFGSIVHVLKTDWGATGLSVEAMALRRQDSDTDPIPLFDGSSQVIDGVAISLSDLGISANTIIYGYSLFGYDVNATDHTLTDITTFPTTTQSSIGGLDLVAGVSAAVASDQNLTTAVGPGGYIESLVTWLKANEDAEVTTSTEGSSVTSWEDHWIGQHDASTSFTAPIYRDATSALALNFNPTIDFSASGTSGLGIEDNVDFNSSADNYLNKSLSIAFRTGTLGNRQVIYEQGGSGNGLNVYIDTDGTLYVGAWANSWTNRPFLQSSSISANTEYILTMELEGDDSGSETGEVRAYLNGSSIGGAVSGAGVLNSHGGDITIGASDANLRYHDGSNTDDNHFEGEISEFIYCNEPTSFPTTGRQKTESYLAIKYGITLDQSSPINYYDSFGNVIFDTTNPSSIGGYLEYNEGIAGIGRDDNSELDQRKSKSESDGSILTIEKTSAFSENDTWLIWGHDGGTTTTTTSDVPATITQRLSREWRVAETNTNSETVNISFDLTGLSLSTNASDFGLLVAGTTSGGSFSAASITTGGTLTGNVLTFSGISLMDGEYLALGTGFDTCYPGGVSTDLYVWLRADKGSSTSTDNSSLDTWSDQSGNGVDATESSSTLQPLYKNNATDNINYNPTIDFDGSNDQLSLGNLANIKSGATNNGDYTLIGIGFREDSDWNFLIGSEGGTADEDLHFGFRNDGTNATLAHWGNDLDVTVSSFTASSAPSLLYGEYDGSSRILEETRNGSFARSTDNNTTDLQGSRTNFIGTVQSLRSFSGRISEVIIFDNDVTDLSKQQVLSYLAIKYGVTLTNNNDNDGTTNEVISGSIREGDYVASDGTTVLWTYSGKSTYHNDVAGIGRDDDSCFAQKQSKSGNSTAIVSIGLGEIASDNLTNSNSFTDNLDFLMWGHDGTSASTTQSTDLPGTATSRLSRVWQVQETGTVGNTQVAFDLTGLGLSSTATDFQLIISSSSTMATGSTVPNGTLSGNVLTFSDVNFSDGDFFTLGTTRSSCSPGGVSTDIELWLNAGQGTNTSTQGGSITSWSDQSGNSNNASQVNLGGSSIQEPTYQIEAFNFNPTVRFFDPSSTNGVYLESDINNVTDYMTFISVFASGQNDGSTTDFESAPTLISSGSSVSTQDYGMGMSQGSIHFNASNSSSLDARSTGTYNDNIPRIATGTREQLTNGEIFLYINSETVATGTSDASSLSASTSFGIANHPSGNVASQFQGDIAETLVFSDVLTSDERNRVESYLALKYGITRNGSDDTGTSTVDERDYRSSNSTVFWDYSLHSEAYNNDIAGIGQDDNSCLLQTKSKSINSGAIVTMEIASSFGSDDSFIMWGNNGEAVEASGTDAQTESVAGLESRVGREWFVQETGDVGDVKVTFDLSDVNSPSGVDGENNLPQLRLMVSSDDDFSSGVTTHTPSDYNSTDKTATFTLNFSNGTFFTLASEEVLALPVTLISFDAEVHNNERVDLQWSTALEIDNSFFTVERSKNALDFEPIGFLDGSGNSSETRHYQFSDMEPLAGQSYYRLKQTDFNGSFTYSELLGVNVALRDIIGRLKIYPNPVKQGEIVHLKGNFNAESKPRVMIFEMSGQLIMEPDLSLDNHTNELILETTNLRPGLYLVKTLNGEHVQDTYRLIVR